VWVANRGDGRVSRISERTGRPGRPIEVGGAPTALAAERGGVLVLDSEGGDVLRIDERSGRVTRVAHVGGAPSSLAVSPSGAVWVVDTRAGMVIRVAP
jgi:DNA-binding beta-propeller fold protein YncE